MQRKKQSFMAGNLDDVLSVPQPLNQFHGTFHGLKTTNWFITWHGNCLLTGFDFSIKILLAIITFLFWILLCHLLNMSSFCIGSISWCCFVVTLFRCSSHIPVFHGIPIVLPVFGCMFHQCSGVPSVFRYSADVPCSVVPCSGVPGFIVCQKFSHTWLIFAPIILTCFANFFFMRQ